MNKTQQTIDDLKMDLGIEEGALKYYKTVPDLNPSKITNTKKNIKSLKQKIRKFKNESHN